MYIHTIHNLWKFSEIRLWDGGLNAAMHMTLGRLGSVKCYGCDYVEVVLTASHSRDTCLLGVISYGYADRGSPQV